MNATLLGFLKKELAQTLRDRRMRIMLFVMPVIQMTLFGLALTNEVRNVRLAFNFHADDTLSREIYDHALASEWFVRPSDSDPDPVHLLQAGRAEAVLVAPPGGLTKAVSRGEGQLQLLLDASNAVRARTVENYLQAIITGLHPNSGAPPLTLSVRMLYNPSMKSAIFMVPGVMCMILTLLTVVLTSMSMAREKEMGTFETLISAPVKSWEILIGKTFPFVLVGLVDVPLVLGVAMGLFGVPMKGQLWELVLASVVFVCTTVSVGTLISTFAKNQQQAMMGGFLFLFPAIQLSGVMYPLDNIPPLVAWVPYLNPLKYFVELMRNIMLKGGQPGVVWPNLGALALLMVISMAVTAKRFKQTLN